MWKIADRLDPELRVEQDVPIEEVVHEYRIAVDTMRNWIQERRIHVPFREYSYFYEAIFELTAESVRRYAKHQADEVRQDRAHHLAAVMHQLRTPLASLSMRIDVLERKGSAVLEAMISKLRWNVRRASVLVEGVLRLERYRPEEVYLRPETFDAAQLIRDVISDYEADAERKGLRFEMHVEPSLQMTCDVDLFVDALGNLVQNAVKFTENGFVIVETESRPDHVVFRVRDSGPGIPEDQKRSLLKEVQPGSAGGAGIGLRIAQHAARAQGGKIESESELGKGSTFSLCLPKIVAARGNPNTSASGGSIGKVQ
jgi:signal transduction histidine kinase